MRSADEMYSSLQQTVLSDLASYRSDPAASRLLARWDKRFIPTDDQLEALHYNAMSSFIDLNKDVSSPQASISMRVAIGEAQDFIFNVLSGYTRSISPSLLEYTPQCVLDLPHLYSLWRFGPGASIGSRYTHFADKIQGPMTTTPRSFHYVRNLRALTPLINRHDCRARKSIGVEIVSGSRLSSVGKNRDVNRTIATEPSGNMAMQLALGLYITRALKRVGLNIETQEDKNKNLAWVASLTGSLCTIDLKSASDLISLDLVKLLWPPEFYHLMCDLRSENCKVPLPDGNFEVIKLNMISTMGNGFTFPMMTLTLLSLVYGFMRESGDLKDRKCDWDRMGVYGDDIICPTKYFPGLCELLSDCGLRVNLDKSYYSGPFRESCGGDYYAGVEITPFYIESLNNDSEVFVAFNKCLKWCVFHDIIMWNTLRFLYSLLERKLLVPQWEDPSTGILSMDCPRRYKILDCIKECKTKYICTDLDLLSIVGGFVEPAKYEKLDMKDSRRHFMQYTERDAPVAYAVKDARLPRGYRDGHDPTLMGRECAAKAACVIDVLNVESTSR